MKETRRVSLVLVLLTALGGCNETTTTSNDDQVGEPAKTAEASAEPTPPAQMRRFDASEARVTEGKQLFGSCVGCHGTDAHGKAGQAPRLASNSFLAAASDDYLFKTIKFGRAGTTMIPWGATFKDPQIEAIIAYLRSLEPAEPAALNEDPLAGDAETGKKLFGDICSACHGDNGAGYQETANGTGIGRAGFLSKATNGFIRYMARNGKSQTAMRPMQGAKNSVANLSDEEIDSIIKYLRKSAW